MISRVAENPQTHNLQIYYIDESNTFQDEEFDLVILSVGLEPHRESKVLAENLGVQTDTFGFCRGVPFDALGTSRPGIFASGVFENPKDIPETVTQASGAAAEAAAMLAVARGTEIREITYPAERPVSGENPRIGVLICHCGINIAGVIDVEALTAYAGTLPGVVLADHFLFTCSTDSQEKIIKAIRDESLNRIIVASCSPRTHEVLFQDTLRKAGLNKYLFEMANIRDQCSWVHQAIPDQALAKAKDLVRMAVARANFLEPLTELPFSVVERALVLGGGAAGLTAALNLARQGFETVLVERLDRLGGQAARLYRTLEGGQVQVFLEELIRKVEAHPLIHLYLGAELVNFTGHMGKFTSTLAKDGMHQEIQHGVVVVASGGEEYRPTEYLFGRDPRILTQLELQEKLYEESGSAFPWNQVVMIQCVGSREEEHPYCSRVCCAQAVANALRIKEISPNTEVIVLYRDIRTYARKELYYKAAREAGVRFVRFEPEAKPEITLAEGNLTVRVLDQNLKMPLIFRPGAVALSAAIRPAEGNRLLAQVLKVPLDADGFFLEAHIKLRPLDFANAGIFLCGLAHGPKALEESITQAKGAAGRAGAILAKKEILVGGAVAIVDEDLCVACLTCLRTCPFGVPRINERHFAEMDPVVCQGCGNCASACPQSAIQVGHMKDRQVLALLEAS
jgi:heterodisulfide reductase subunit A-like polyferredoxin